MYILADVSWPLLLFLAGLALAIFILRSRSRKYFARNPSQGASPAASHAATRRPAHFIDAPDELRRWHVEMYELARDASAQIDTKISLLQALIVDAELVSERLEKLLMRLDCVAHSENADATLRDREAADDATDEAASEARRETRLARIYSLADAGLSPTAIAQQLNRQVGDIELLLSVRSPRPSG